jgi:hypothetical protein
MPTKSASKTITRDQAWLGPAIPPGEILLEEYLKPLGLGQLEAAKRLGISLNRLNEIVPASGASPRIRRCGLHDCSRHPRSCGCACKPTGICIRPCGGQPARHPNVICPLLSTPNRFDQESGRVFEHCTI